MDRAAEHVYTPTELNREVKLHLEMGFPRILLEAEVSNLSRPASGHQYFTLKDERAQVRCAMFRSAALRAKLRPANGMLVQARDRVQALVDQGMSLEQAVQAEPTKEWDELLGGVWITPAQFVTFIYNSLTGVERFTALESQDTDTE